MRTLFVLALLGLLAFAGAKGQQYLPSLDSPPSFRGHEVVLYADSGSAEAWEAAEFYRQRGLRVRVRDIRTDATAHAEYVRMGGGELPVSVIGAHRLHGFRSWEAERVLDQLSRTRGETL